MRFLKSFIKGTFNFKGKATRKELLLELMVSLIFVAIIFALFVEYEFLFFSDYERGESPYEIVNIIFEGICWLMVIGIRWYLLALLALYCRRLNDARISKLVLLLLFVSFIRVFVIILLVGLVFVPTDNHIFKKDSIETDKCNSSE